MGKKKEKNTHQIFYWLLLVLFLILFLMPIQLVVPFWFIHETFATYAPLLQQASYQLVAKLPALSLAIGSVILCIIQFKVRRNKIALTITCAILFLIFFIILDIISLYKGTHYNKKLMSLWAIGNIFIGCIIFLDVLLIHLKKTSKLEKLVILNLIFVFMVFSACFFILFFKPQSLEPLAIFSVNGFQLLSLLLYSIIAITIHPQINKLTSMTILFVFIVLLETAHEVIIIRYFSEKIFLTVYFIKYTFYVILFCFLFTILLKWVLSQQKAIIKNLLFYDGLTGLFNRKKFDVFLEKKIQNSSEENYNFGLILIDIDNFKNINDQIGHLHGDRVLKQCTKRIRSSKRKRDFLARIGGDEFALITNKLIEKKQGEELAENLIRNLSSKPYIINKKQIKVTASVGLCFFPEDALNKNELLMHTSIALYKAKITGKNAYKIYTPELFHERILKYEIAKQLNSAIQSNELHLVFQPIYDLSTMEIIGAEALLRWENKKLGKISPLDFIPIAEKTGIIIDIGYWVINNVLNKIKLWQKKFNKKFFISINISVIQLKNQEFIKKLKKILMNFDVSKHSLVLEITESIFIIEFTYINQCLKELANLGVRIAVDDFGTGYSSLSRVTALPIHFLKIDKYFLKKINRDLDKSSLIHIMIQMCELLNCCAIAEGIENTEQLKYLKKIKCSLGQGYLLAKPLESNDFERLLHRSSYP